MTYSFEKENKKTTQNKGLPFEKEYDFDVVGEIFDTLPSKDTADEQNIQKG